MSSKKIFGFKKLINVDEALEKYLSMFNIIPDYEIIDVIEGIGRVLIDDVKSPEDIPPFDRAAIDGYAVRSIDVSGASETSPVSLKIVGVSTTDNPFKDEIKAGEAVRIDTGSPMPKGSDAVIMLEDTVRKGSYIEVLKPASPLENVSVKGEDIKRGETIVYGGIPLTPYDIASLVNTGIYKINVYRKIKIGLAAIGSELLEFPEELPLGKVREVNRIMVKGILSWLPTKFKDYGIYKDNKEVVKNIVRKGIQENDIMITIGGSSLGEGDVVTDIAEEFGKIVIHGVALYPSRPVLLSIIRGKPYLGIPGYPVAAAISTKVFLEPLIMKLSGIRGYDIKTVIRGRLKRKIASKIGLRHYVRVKVRFKNNEWVVNPIYASGAGVLSSLSLGDGYLIIPEDREGFDEGDIVDVILYRRVIR